MPARCRRSQRIRVASGSTWSLPGALERALPTVGGRVQALVIDEGQDFDELWLMLLEQLLVDPKRGVLYVFHDPAQAIYRPDAVATLGLEEYPLPDNCRNARPIHDLAYRFYDGTLPAEAVREDGREPLIVEAEGPVATVDAVRAALHDLVHVEKVDRAQIAVLTGVSLEHSATWRQRRFKGDLVLWNGGVDDEGRSQGPLGRPGAGPAPGHDPVREHLPLQGPRARRGGAGGDPARGRAPAAADVRRRDAGQAPPGGDRAAGTCGVAAVMVFVGHGSSAGSSPLRLGPGAGSSPLRLGPGAACLASVVACLASVVACLAPLWHGISPLVLSRAMSSRSAASQPLGGPSTASEITRGDQRAHNSDLRRTLLGGTPAEAGE